MNKIRTAIYGKAPIILEGISSLLEDNEEIVVEHVVKEENRLHYLLRSKANINILILFIETLSDDYIRLIENVSQSYTSISILIISIENNDDIIMKTIKAGAKGFLNKDSDSRELAEAIYTIRNGYDYYSKSISRILINNYLHKKTDNSPSSIDVKDKLTKRELEILKLWGESYTNGEIAEQLFISIRTVETHKNRIMQKINLKTTVDLVKFAILNNIIKI